MLQTIAWTGSAARILDQTKLPAETAYLDLTDERQTWDAIKRLAVRGAPAIGIAAAFGAYLGVRDSDADYLDDFDRRLNDVCDYLATSRPTAVNLFWALDRMKRVSAETRKQGSRDEPAMVQKIKQRLLAECLSMIEEDTAVCRAIGEHGLRLLAEGVGGLPGVPPMAPLPNPPIAVLTHCNAGGLATARYGTALAPIYLGAERGLRFHVYADETRPLWQGARITAYELQAAGIPVTVLCDNMAATLMRDRKVNAVIVGTDRVAANGDVANKIGTLTVAILARHFALPFYVAAPTSSIDLSLPDGSAIPIEQRDGDEVTRPQGRPIAPAGVEVYNPAFDVTPAELVTAIITEKGTLRPPYRESLRHACGK